MDAMACSPLVKNCDNVTLSNCDDISYIPLKAVELQFRHLDAGLQKSNSFDKATASG
jgi:hypothetical protein